MSETTMSAREEILARVRAALGRDDGPAEPSTAAGDATAAGETASAAPASAPEVPRDYRRTSEMGAEERIEQLVDRLEDYKAWVRVVEPAEVPAAIAERLEGAKTVVAASGLDAALTADLPESTTVVRDAAQPGDGEVSLSVAELDAADAVITASRVSAAQTGTIFLDGAPECGRRAISLVPDHHICIVPESSIVEIVPEAVARIEITRTITMISGPSATSDIELERVEGVHGPRRLDVLIVRGQ